MLLCFGKLVANNGIWIELIYSSVQKKRCEISGLCNGMQRTTTAKMSRTDIL